MAGGRPTDYSVELGQEICEVISTTSRGLKRLCAEREHWPVPSTIYLWRLRHAEFSELYAQARINRVEVIIDELIDIADDTTHDTITKYGKNDEPYDVQNSEWINRSRLRIDTRKWLAVKLAHRMYGDKVQTEHSGSINLHEQALEKLK